MTHETEGTDGAGRALAADPSKDPGTTVEKIMTRDVVTLDMDDPLHLIQRIFQREGFHHLLVLLYPAASQNVIQTPVTLLAVVR